MRTTGKEIKRGKPIAVLAADLHIRSTRPRSRKDDYVQAIKNKLEYITGLCYEHDCSALIAGDIFDKPNAGPVAELLAIDYLRRIYASLIPGQHDLPYHQLDRMNEASISVLLLAAKGITAKKTKPGEADWIFAQYRFNVEGHKGIMLHGLVSPEPLWPGHQPNTPSKLFKMFPDADLILTGDNHQPFTAQSDDGRWLVNPGSMMRSNIDQRNHKPRVYLWDGENVWPEYLPIEEDVWQQVGETSEQKKEREARMSAYVERMSKQKEIKLSFRDNLDRFFDEEKPLKQVQTIIVEALDAN